MTLVDSATAQHSTAQHSNNHCLNFSENKILLVSLYGNNYGNILQRYSLARTIESLGFEVDNLCPYESRPPRNYLLEAATSFKKSVKTLIKRMLALAGIRKYLDKQLTRESKSSAFTKKLNAFCDKYIKRKIFVSYDEMQNINKSQWDKYKFAVTGSDQVWRIWLHTIEQAECYYLEFMSREKRVCYAPSFGFTQFYEPDINLHKKGLEGFDKLSCREQEGVNLIKQLINKDAKLVLDPTLLLNASQWREIECKPDINLPDRYVLTYFLGRRTQEYERAIKQAAGDLPVIDIYNGAEAFLQNYVAGIEEFLYLFDHADFVLTNSFHGTVFAINFGKKFYSFTREYESFSRIQSILDSLNLANHAYKSESNSRPDEINYHEVNEKLNILRESSIKYLRECLNV